MMSRQLIAAVLLSVSLQGPLAYAQGATTCQDLRLLKVERAIMQPTRLLDLVEELIRNTGWKVESNFMSVRGPAVHGRLSFASTEDALRYVAWRAVHAGWRMDMLLNRARCTIMLYVDPTQLVAVAQPSAGGAVGTLDVWATGDGEPKRIWQVQAGKSLRETLAAWAQQAGWKIYWDAKEDFNLLAAVVFLGEFEDSVAKLLSAINAHGHTFRAEAYAGNKVLRIVQ